MLISSVKELVEKCHSPDGALYCTNYKAEVDSLSHAVHTIALRANQDTQVVFLTGALAVLQAYNNDRQPSLKKALNNIKSLKTVLQRIPCHSGIEGNERADKLTKKGSES